MKTEIIKLLAFVLALQGCNDGVKSQTTESCQRTLKVSLYPYLPNVSDLYWKLEVEFERLHPDIELIIDLNSWYYYAQDSTRERGINFDEADVYELDCIFLKEFIEKGKIQKLPSSFNLDERDFLPMASIAKSGNSWYGVPHWVCGNFMYYKEGDNDISKVDNLKDLEHTIDLKDLPNNGLLIDLKGKSTIGELYLDALLDEYSSYTDAKQYIEIDNINNATVDNLNRVLKLTDANLGRIDDYHDRLGYYARKFSRNKARVYVGYAETSYYMINEKLQSCSLNEACLDPSEIQIGEWSISDNGSTPIGWVDLFVIDSKVNAEKLSDAKAFIDFMMKDQTYKMILTPGWGEAPRYILPSKVALYSDGELLEKAPLYSKFFPIIKKAVSVSDAGLNYRLRQIGKKLDEELLID